MVENALLRSWGGGGGGGGGRHVYSLGLHLKLVLTLCQLLTSQFDWMVTLPRIAQLVQCI